jgi:hypothetical protein
MSQQKYKKFIDFKVNGKLFPTWILANFKSFKLPEVFISDKLDPCSKVEKERIREYQLFISKILDFNGPYRDILVYHGLGSGKTLTAINLYNVLYNSTPAWNVFVLLKATLKDDPWMKDLKTWLQTEDSKFRMDNIKFISYDAPNADKAFMDAVKNADTSKKNLYIIEEAHNFIRNVYSNISSKHGKRAQIIYDYILQDKKENDGVRVVLLTATPTINKPYELALIFNLLRPNIFPKSEAQFNQIYVSSLGGGFEILNPLRKNNFQRRILGLTSYYVGATPDVFPSKTISYVDVDMSPYQEDINKFYEELEDKIAKKSKGKSQTYMSYTRQSCNFVFPSMAQGMTGETRPRPRNFKISDILDKGNQLEEDKDKDKETYYNVQSYLDSVNKFVDTFDNYLSERFQNDKKKNYTLADDIKKIREKYNYDLIEFIKKEEQKSSLIEGLYNSSSKMLMIIINILRSPGPVLVYSNYVLMEGLQIFKIYLKYFGFSEYKDRKSGIDNFRYMEYHGMIKKEDRTKNLVEFNVEENKYGKICKIIMISPAGAEGLTLLSTRQVHIMEPYWHEVRIKQMIGRAVRMCSHRYLPMNERNVEVFRYKSIKTQKSDKVTTDQLIENLARSKEGLLQSFEDAVKEAAIDCELYKSHNLLQNDYKCFKFDEQALFADQIGPAYKEDIIDDLKMDSGSNAIGYATVRVKVIKIKAVKIISNIDGNIKYSDTNKYWFNPDTNIVYDYDLYYPVGKVSTDDDGIPYKMDDNSYIIDKVIPIPYINDK